MPTVAAPIVDLAVTTGTVARWMTTPVGTDVEVWLTGKDGGARIMRLPTYGDDVLAPDGRPVVDAVTWSRKRGADDTASFEIARYAKDGDDVFWLSHITQWETDVQITFGGAVMFWGPVQSKPTLLGAPRVRIDCVGVSWRLGRRMLIPPEAWWDRNLAVNAAFDEGLSHWNGSATTLDTIVFETGTQSADVAAGGVLSQAVSLPLEADVDLRVRARVLRDTAVTGRLRVTRDDGSAQLMRTSVELSGATAGEWAWVEATARVLALGTPAQVRFGLDDIAGPGGVHVDRWDVRVMPPPAGSTDRDGLVPMLQPAQAVAWITAEAGGDLNIGLAYDPSDTGESSIPAEWWATPMRASEALRIPVEEAGQEQRWVYNTATRILEAMPLVGVEHDPAVLTLRPVGGEGAGVYGNVTGVEDGGGGMPNPITRVIARSEDGITETVEDMTGLNMVFDELIQAPVGVTDLRGFAESRLRASVETATSYPLGVTDQTLIGVLDIGDRVRLVADDGPDSIDGLVRIEQVTCTPGAAVPMQVVAVPWVEPVEGVKVPRAERAFAPVQAMDEVVSQGRRINDVERRLTAVSTVDVFPDLKDVPAWEDITEPDPGEVTIWAANRTDYPDPRWEPLNLAVGGGSGGYATARATGDTTPDSWLDWSEASDPTWEPTLYAGGLGTDVCGGIVVAEPGFYDVAVVGVSEDAFTIEAFADSAAGGWQFESEVGEDPPFCRSNLKIMEGADAGDGGASGSIQMALAADHRVLVRIVTAGTVEWSLSLELVAPADIVDGSCGG